MKWKLNYFYAFFFQGKWIQTFLWRFLPYSIGLLQMLVASWIKDKGRISGLMGIGTIPMFTLSSSFGADNWGYHCWLTLTVISFEFRLTVGPTRMFLHLLGADSNTTAYIIGSGAERSENLETCFINFVCCLNKKPFIHSPWTFVKKSFFS